MAEKIYSRVIEAEEMIKAICEKYPKVFWRVRPQTVQVWGVENKDRSKKDKTLAKIKAVRGVEKAIMQDANLSVRFHIDLYWSDWREWREEKKQGVLVHELIHVHEEPGKLIKHDIEDFSIVVDQTGAKGDRYDNFPNVLTKDVEFDLSLLPKTEEVDEEDKDEIDEEEAEKKRHSFSKKAVEITDKANGVVKADDEDNVF